jgi:integrase/recombinase XerD
MVSKSRTKRMFYRNNEVPVEKAKKSDGQTLYKMFDQFMLSKTTEGLAKRTISDYHIHFQFFLDYLGNHDLNAEDINLDIFRGYIGYMLYEKNLNPMTVNVRVRTIRAFIRYCHLEGWVTEPIHERFKPIKTKEDTLSSFTPEEINKLIHVIDDSTYKGFRDIVIVYVLLDTLVRCGELG